jgi:hypothetical protein
MTRLAVAFTRPAAKNRLWRVGLNGYWGIARRVILNGV